MAAKPKDIDWDRMESEWRAGIVSVSTLSREYGVSRTSLEKHWNKLGVPRDLTAKVKAKTDAIVMGASVELDKGANKGATNKAVTEKQIIEANANIQATIQLRQRGRIQKHQDLGEKLLKELELQTTGIEDFERLAELMKSDDGFDKLNELYKKVIATPSRIDSFKKLSESLKTLTGLERQAFGMSDNANGDAPAQQRDKPSTEFVRSIIADVNASK